MKPRISRHQPSKGMTDFNWKCVAEGLQGIGETPTNAYWDWRFWKLAKLARERAAARGVEIDQRVEA